MEKVNVDAVTTDLRRDEDSLYNPMRALSRPGQSGKVDAVTVDTFELNRWLESNGI